MLSINLTLKRLIDIIISMLMLVLFFPFLMIIGLIVFFSSGWPIIFCQTRAGKHGKGFTIFKFRTMRNSSKGTDKGIKRQDPRITFIGHTLRKWSIDELPQLINVLMGDMSFVGPRPLLIEYVDRYNELQKRRLEMKPGITGLQQVECRYESSWERKFEYDLLYINSFNLLLDFKILLKTVKIILFLPSQAESGGVTTEFLGDRR